MLNPYISSKESFIFNFAAVRNDTDRVLVQLLDSNDWRDDAIIQIWDSREETGVLFRYIMLVVPSVRPENIEYICTEVL